MGQQHNNTKGKGAPHLNQAERKIIERMLKENVPKKQIARILCRDIRTIRREIKRGSVEQRKSNSYISKDPRVPEYFTYKAYYADCGQRVYEANRRQSGANRKIIPCRELVAYVEEKVLGPERWSPDAAIGYARENGLFSHGFTTKTFYNWVGEGLVKVKNLDLPLKTRRRPKRSHAERKKVLGKSIDERPCVVDERLEFGHWEGDGIVGKNRSGHLITLVERTTGAGFLFNAGDRKSERIIDILDKLQSRFDNHFKSVFKTITFDNGPEFSASDQMEHDGRIAVYYAHPYSAWERPVNEHYNGLVRRFFPKGTRLDNVSDSDLARVAHYLNTMPRKRLRYKSPWDLWLQQLSAIIHA